MRVIGRANAVQITTADGEVNILLSVTRADVEDGALYVHYRRGMNYDCKEYPAGKWTECKEV